MRDRYVFSYPEPSAYYLLMAEDLDGNILKDGVTWELADQTLGRLVPGPDREYARRFDPVRAPGETIVTARTVDASDTATIVVYPGWGWNTQTFPGSLHGFNFARGKFVTNEAEADIWWPGESRIRFECGYWTDINLIALIDNLDTLTAEDKELCDGPIDYKYYTDTDQLFLVRTRQGAVYAAIVTRAKIVYKPTPIIPAPQ